MSVRVAINGFGRIGRSTLRSALMLHPELDIIAINDLGSADALTRQFSRDFGHGPVTYPVTTEGSKMAVAHRTIVMSAQRHARSLPWKELDIDVVIESTGRYTSRKKALEHLEAGAKRVIVSAPVADADATFVIGINESRFDPLRHFVISTTPCTTNCLATLAKVLDDAFGIEDGFMTTVHARTDDQNRVDVPHKGPRRARAAATNIVPTTTGAARAIGLVLPRAKGHLDGLSLRVPIPDVSITDLVVNVKDEVDAGVVNEAFRTAASTERLKALLEYSDEPLVSSDIVNLTASCIFDSQLTTARGNLVKVFGWHDNKSGYASRLADLAALVGAAA